ncbi:acyl-CoA thioesterase [Angustibacter aerolatus]
MPELPTRDDFPHRALIATRWADDDHYGHANNTVYYAWFDTVLNAWLMEATGTDTRRLPAIGVMAESSCRFLASVGFPDRLEVGLAVERLGRTSVTYRLGLFRDGDDDLKALGRLVHVYVDAGTRRPAPVPEPVRRVVEQLERGAQDGGDLGRPDVDG